MEVEEAAHDAVRARPAPAPPAAQEVARSAAWAMSEPAPPEVSLLAVLEAGRGKPQDAEADATQEQLSVRRYVAQVSTRVCRKREKSDSRQASEAQLSEGSTMLEDEGTPLQLSCRGLSQDGAPEEGEGAAAQPWLLDDVAREPPRRPLVGAGPPRILVPGALPCEPADDDTAERGPGEDSDITNKVLNERTQWRPPPISHEHVHRAFGLGARIMAAHKAKFDGQLSSQMPLPEADASRP